MDKLKQGAERLKTSGAQMGRTISGKMKDLLQAPTTESKMVDEATSDHLQEPNWGMNLRICGMLNSEEFSGQEVVKAIKKKISGKNEVTQRLSLDLLEACAMNCEKVFSEIASEKVLDEMVKLIENSHTVEGNRLRAFQLIRAWGESPEVAYLPVFRHTFDSLKAKGPTFVMRDGNLAFSSLGVDQQSVSPPANYPPISDMNLHDIDDDAFAYQSGSLSVEEKKELLVTARNSVELLSSMLNAEEPMSTEDELTLSMLEKCKESQPMIQRIIESTNDDEAMLFEALNLNDELQQVIAKYEEVEASVMVKGKSQQHSETGESVSQGEVGDVEKAKINAVEGENTEVDNDKSSSVVQESIPVDGGDKKNAPNYG